MNLINGDSNLCLKCELALANCYFSSHSEVLTVAVVVLRGMYFGSLL